MTNYQKLAEVFVKNSLDLQKGEKILIKYKNGILAPLVKEVVKKVFECGGIPCVKMEDQELKSLLNSLYTKEAAEMVARNRKYELDTFDAQISLGYNDNYEKYGKADVDYKRELSKQLGKLGIQGKATEKWLLFNYPSRLDAQNAMKDYTSYEEMMLNAVIYDYKQLRKDSESLRKLIADTKEIKIVSADTNLTFRKDNIDAVTLAGEHNLPDGEIYTSPIKNSVNGYITYNIPSRRGDFVFDKIKLFFENGKVVNFETEGDQDAFRDFISIDEGSSFVGEFAFGLNKKVVDPVLDVLCDEKIHGSIHLALGNSYDDAFNGNKSALHWDMVKIMKKEYGGGEIYFDGKLIQKDGRFTQDNLQALNDDEIEL